MYVFLGIYYKGVNCWKVFIIFICVFLVYFIFLYVVIKVLIGNFELIDYNDENIISYFVVYFYLVIRL